MAYDRESIIRKLKKMRAKAESAEAIGSEAEAQAFAEQVQRMLSDYKVEEAEIAKNVESEADPIKQVRPPYQKYGIKYKRRDVPWARELAGVVAWAHYCRSAFVPNTNQYFFCGRESDAELAGEVWAKLHNSAEAIADREYVKFFYEAKQAGEVWRARGFRQSFLVGFVRRLDRRYFEHMEQIREYYAHDKRALVTLKDARSRVDEWVGKNLKLAERRATEPKVENREGYRRGQEKAQELPLHSAKEVG